LGWEEGEVLREGECLPRPTAAAAGEYPRHVLCLDPPAPAARPKPHPGPHPPPPPPRPRSGRYNYCRPEKAKFEEAFPRIA
jgi:hypothetical protein